MGDGRRLFGRAVVSGRLGVGAASESIPTIIRDLNARLEAERLTLTDELLSEVRRDSQSGEPCHSGSNRVHRGPAEVASPTVRPCVDPPT